MNTTLWYISILLTILIWGTWLIISRRSAAGINNPFLENVLITFGALIFNVAIFIGYILLWWELSWDWTYFLYPFLSGILWAFAGLFAFIACSKIWVWKAMAIWAPSGMIVSFLWWILYYGEFSSNIFAAIAAVIVIVIWVSCVIYSRNAQDNSKIGLSGILFAFAASLVWGWTYLIPLKELSAQISPFFTLLPLSIGMLFGAVGIFIYKSNLDKPLQNILKIGYPIIVSWIMWALWNFFAIIAVLHLWMWKAYPLAELCTVVNALFAVFFLKEMKWHKNIHIFFIWTVVSLLWAIWLSILKI